MADLGAIGMADSQKTRAKAVPVMSPDIYKPPTSLDPKLTDFNLSGRISGVVTVGGVPQSRVRVGLMHRSSMRLISQAHTDGAGAYQFKFLDITDVGNYFVVFLDPNESAPWNYSLVRDHLSPG